MAEVNEGLGHIKKLKGKKALPVERRRVLMSIRVEPSTKRYLEAMGYNSMGRAIDVLVKAVQHGGIRKMIDDKADFKVINLTG